MAAFPDHVAVRLVAEDGDVLAADQVGDVLQILLGGNAAGRVVRRVEEDRLGRGVIAQEPFDLGDLGAEGV